VIEAGGPDATLRRVLEVVLDALGTESEAAAGAAGGAKLSEPPDGSPRKGTAR
jgi:hypothetical protein